MVSIETRFLPSAGQRTYLFALEIRVNGMAAPYQVHRVESGFCLRRGDLDDGSQAHLAGVTTSSFPDSSSQDSCDLEQIWRA